jgi:hypothetical protein
MRKNLRDVSSADDDEERYLDEEGQEEEPAPKSRKRKKKGELRSSIPDDAPPPALSPEDQMMTIWKNTELGLQAVIQTKGLVIRNDIIRTRANGTTILFERSSKTILFERLGIVLAGKTERDLRCMLQEGRH